MRLLIFLFTTFCLLTGLESFAQDAIKIVVGGPSSLKLLQGQKSELEKAAGMPVEFAVSPLENGISALIKGMVDGMVCGKPEEALAIAEKKGLGKQNLLDYQSHALSEVTIKIGVHPENPVTALSHQQLKDILNGTITSWEPITGKKLPIVVLLAKNYQLALKVVQDTYTNGKPVPIAQSVIDKDGLIKGIQKEPGALGIFTEREGLADFMPKFIRSDAKQTTYFLMKKKSKPASQKLFDFINAQPTARQD